jgi:hypothetical protein
MGPKQKAKGKGKDEEDDTSTVDLLAIYKKQCRQHEIPYSKVIENQINSKLEEDTHLQELLIDDKIGEEGMIQFSKALKLTNKNLGYKHLQSIRVWEGNIGNQGLRSFYNYIVETKNYNINILEFINCGIEKLGCEFISRMLYPTLSYNIKILILDYNKIGDEGLKELTKGLSCNITINYLSLNYCEITNDGMPYLKSIFENDNSGLEKLYVQGNHIGNESMSELLDLLSTKEELPLEEINLSNTNIGSNATFINSLLLCMKNNKTIHTYNLKYNLISKFEFKQIISLLKDQKTQNDSHIFQILIDEVYEELDFKTFFDILKSRKKPKKKNVKKPKNK